MNYKERNAYFARRRAKLKAKGICIICGKREAAAKCIRCVECRQRHRDCQRNRQLRQQIAEQGHVPAERKPRTPYHAVKHEWELTSWAWSHPAGR